MGDIFANLFSSAVVLGLVRNGVLAISSGLVAQGWIDGSTQQTLAAGAVGLVTIIASGVANALKHRNQKVINAVSKEAPAVLSKAAASVGTTATKVVN